MRAISDVEASQIRGGFKGFFFGAAIVTFLIGLIDGFVRPLKCNS